MFNNDPRGLRRHHRERLLKKRRFYFGTDHEQEGREAWRGRLAKTSTPCSCWMCGNPRKFFGARSVGERRDAQEIHWARQDESCCPRQPL